MKIEDIQSPEFLKQCTIEELNTLCDHIRTFIIDHVSQTGGHLSANLGVVELVVAMHYVFSSPHDKMIFDVGHQAYTHKILTGRAKEFDHLRMKMGFLVI
jgi:1-deoxy-D-xylulose-5-phosphate synthase